MSLPPIPTVSPKQIEHNNHSDAAGGQTGRLADEIMALRPGEAMSTPLDTIAFSGSTGMLNPCRPSAMDERITWITHVLLVTISIVMTQGLARAQSSAPRETLLSSSATAEKGAWDNRPTSIQHGPSDQESTRPCSLRMPDTIPDLALCKSVRRG